MSRHPFVQAAVSRRVRSVPTGGSWWTNAQPKNFTAEATKCFNWRLRGVMPSESTDAVSTGFSASAGVTHPAENTRRARGPYKPRVDESMSEVSTEFLAEREFAVESADTETE